LAATHVLKIWVVGGGFFFFIIYFFWGGGAPGADKGFFLIGRFLTRILFVTFFFNVSKNICLGLNLVGGGGGRNYGQIHTNRGSAADGTQKKSGAPWGAALLSTMFSRAWPGFTLPKPCPSSSRRGLP
ncbi:hypothetical protein, partial [Stenotrophomonas maltophilia]|uniref:hypothetical protein n=1 Tax=Stenotrophomonas maltophilia TaxID=40324 RepID=UPI002556707E